MCISCTFSYQLWNECISSFPDALVCLRNLHNHCPFLAYNPDGITTARLLIIRKSQLSSIQITNELLGSCDYSPSISATTRVINSTWYSCGASKLSERLTYIISAILRILVCNVMCVLATPPTNIHWCSNLLSECTAAVRSELEGPRPSSQP